MAEELRIDYKNIDVLLPDQENPRIPHDKRALEPNDLIKYVANKYDSLTIARSITQHRFFPSEPLIVLAEGDNFIVLEGNRRLAALKILLNPELRNGLTEEDEWNALATDKVSNEVPVIVVPDRRSVAPIIGYRHISGIEQWDPYAKARYIASQIDDSELTFEQTAIEVGEKVGEVRANYRNYRIAQQALEEGIDIGPLTDNFGTFTRAMSSTIREFIDAPRPQDVAIGSDPIPATKTEELGELISYLFGENRVITDSRDLGRLATVLGSEDGVQILRSDVPNERKLSDAYIASGGLLQRLLNSLSTARTSLRSAQVDMATYKEDVDVQRLLKECAEALEVLQREAAD